MDAGQRIVLSADRPPSEIAGLDERVASRLQAGLAVAVEAPDAALRLSILRAKAARAVPGARLARGRRRAGAPGLSHHLQRRVLEGASRGSSPTPR
jgi:hypothetical protein